MSTVLVVDDESNMRFLLRMILETEGWDVVEAGNGATALQLAKTSRPDLVITDLMMPLMDGRELVERLRSDSETADVPIVVLSASTRGVRDGPINLGFFTPDEQEDEPQAWCAGCDAALTDEGEWNDASEGVAQVTLICDGCFEDARRLNARFVEPS